MRPSPSTWLPRGLTLFSLLASAPAWADAAAGGKEFHAAIAHSDTSGIPGKAVHGVLVNQPTNDAAEKGAMAACQKAGGTHCKVVLHWHDGCGAWAEAQKGKPLNGWAVRPTEAAASEEVEKDCVKAGGQECKVRAAHCSTGKM